MNSYKRDISIVHDLYLFLLQKSWSIEKLNAIFKK